MSRHRVLPILPDDSAATLPLVGLDTLWFQLTGTLCNIACRHCFIACGPKQDRVPMMTMDRVAALIDEARDLGVKEFYFTGGEPMLHPQFFAIIERALRDAPTHVLTNGMLIDADAADRLRRLFDAAPYSLELRVSLDGMTAAENDPVRGRGTFAATTAGLVQLARVGLSPGNYQAKLTIVTDGGTRVVPVTMTVPTSGSPIWSIPANCANNWTTPVRCD